MAPTSGTISALFFLVTLTSNWLGSAQQQQNSFTASDSPWLPLQNHTLVSPNRAFAAGFRLSSGGFLFAIWAIRAPDPILWSLNRHHPVNSSSPLTISPLGRLSLSDSMGRNLFPPNAISTPPKSSSLLLHENGSLVFDSWTSFDQPTNTILAGQPITTINSGSFQLINATCLVFNHTDTYWCLPGTLLGFTLNGTLLVYGTGNDQFTSDVGNDHILRRLTLDRDGNLRVYSLYPHNRQWQWHMVWRAASELCTIHGTCGPNSICLPKGYNDTTCVCPPGYKEVTSGGCNRKIPFLPSSKYLQMDHVSFTNNPDTTSLTPLDFNTCQTSCSSNRSCIAFSYQFSSFQFPLSQFCFHHFNSLFSAYWSPGSTNAMYIRVSISEKDISNFTSITTMIDTACPLNISLPVLPKESKTTLKNVAIISTIFALELLVGILSFCALLRKYSNFQDMARNIGLEFLPDGMPRRFSLAELRVATGNFSHVIGEGGFGVVYKGVLPNKRTIAVKRLKQIAAASGEAGFWAEVTNIGRMHHLNLVRMWGFCAEKDQRMLVYEFIPNGSLDKFLFPRNQAGTSGKTETNPKDELGDTETSTLTDTQEVDKPPPALLFDLNTRYRIAIGVARAIAYLHEECLEWVLHCDIKPENILIDGDFCPKVSDFGLSKLTNKRDRVTMSTRRGTRGYMAPEWVLPREPITAKADVYSFGMVLLEMVTGMRSFNFYRASLESANWYFPKWVFEKVYIDKRMEDVLDHPIQDSYNGENVQMVERMVNTAMWCLQNRAEMRPSMGKVAKMLEGSVEITEPPKPPIFSEAPKETTSLLPSYSHSIVQGR